MFSTRPSLLACASLVAILLAPVSLDAQETAPLPRAPTDGFGQTRSESGEIVVTGPDPHTRGIYCDFAVRTDEEFRKLMGVGERIKYPIRINLRPMPGNYYGGYPVIPEVIIEPRYSPNVHVALCDSFRFSYLREELVRFLLLERALHNHPQPGELLELWDGQLIPRWLWAGVGEALSFQESGEPSELFRSIFKAGTILGVDEILGADPEGMNTLSKAVYRASAGGLVMTLLEQDGGRERMLRFIEQLATAPQDQEALLRKHFPGINASKNSLEKWWLLRAAEYAEPSSLDILSIQETEERLARALEVGIVEVRAPEPGEPNARDRRPLLRIFGARRDEEEPKTVALPVEPERSTYGLTDYRDFIEREDFAQIVSQSEARLKELSFRSFPLHRPLIQAYLDLIADLKAGQTKGADARFAALGATREGLLRSGEMATDVLNLHQATAIGETSGAFKEIDRLAEELEAQKPVRKDALSRYLDRVQAEHD